MKQYTRSNGIGNEFGSRNFDEGSTSRDRSRDHLNKLFVGNIANTTDEHELKVFVEGFGYEVVQVDLRVDPQTNRRRGFGFVKLGGVMDEQMLRIAAEEMNNHELSGRKLTVNLALPKK